MNKIYKLCEYGISIYTVQKLKEYSLDELTYKMDQINVAGSLGVNRKQQILNVLNSEEFKNDSSESVYELINYGISLSQIQILENKKITIQQIINNKIDDLDISKQLKDKLKAIEIITNKKAVSKDVDFSDLLEREIKKIVKPFEVLTVNLLRNELIVRNTYPMQYFRDDLNKLKNEDKIEITNNGIYYRVPTLEEEIQKLKEDKNKSITIERLRGKTLFELANNFGISRERIRQIVDKVICNFPTIKEDKFKNTFSTYNWNKELFCEFYNQTEKTYNYLETKYKKGNVDLIELYNIDNIEEKQIKVLNNHLGYIEIYNERIKNNPEVILETFIKNEAIDKIFIEELYEKYREFYFKNNFKIIEGLRNFESVICRKNYVLNNINKQVRYYDIDKIISKDKLKLQEMLDCTPGEYSTLYFFNIYNEFMQEIDIRNEYELHNLIRILGINNSSKSVILNKMPHIFIGIEDKHKFFEEHLRELSPVSSDEAAQFFYENFGHKIESSTAYIRSEFRGYLDNDIIRFNIEQLDEDVIKTLKNRIDSDLCSVSNAKEIFEMILGKDYMKYFNSYNLNLMGYRLKSDYIQSNTIVSLESYILEKISDKKIIYLEDIPLYKLNSIYNILRNSEKNFDIIKISNNKYLNFKVLEKAGITKKDLIEYGTRAKKEFLPGEFFTLYSLRNKIGESKLDEEGFDNYFYESLIFHTEGIRKISIDNNNIFYITNMKDKNEYSAKDLVKDIFESRDSMKFSELLKILEDEYGLYIKNHYLIIELLRENKYYYNNVLNKIYVNKLVYLNDIYEEE